MFGERELVKNMTGLAAGPKTFLSTAIKNGGGKQLEGLLSAVTIIMFIVNVGFDIIGYTVDRMLGIINRSMYISKILVSVLYNILKTVGGAILRGVLIPFIGPFAWIVGAIVDFGLDWLVKTFNILDLLSQIVNWIIQQGAEHISAFMSEFAR